MKEEKIQNNTYSRTEFIDIRKQYIQSIVRSSNLIDKTLITLTSATIGGSFLYLTSGKGTLNNKHLLVISWLLLGLTLLFVLCSFYLSEQANQNALKKLDKKQELNMKGTKDEIEKLKDEIEKLNMWIKRLKWRPIITLTIGVLFLALFIFYNI